jgi:hypothetical protein
MVLVYPPEATNLPPSFFGLSVEAISDTLKRTLKFFDWGRFKKVTGSL